MIVRTIVCIPTFNNSKTIRSVVEGCLAHSPFPILVIDDGSQQQVQELIEKNSRITVVRHEKNQGKGAALKTAFHWAIEKGYTHLISIDGDGQHLPSDLGKFSEAITTSPWDLIVGHRKLSGKNVPEVSKFGRKFSNFWVKYQTETPIQDSQSGFRAYPLFHIQNLKLIRNHYDLEIEVLIRLMWKGVGVKEIEIEAFYPPESERVTHFDKWTDNVRISILNTVLVVVSMFRSRLSSRQLAFAIGVGVFIGCTPLFGAHSFIAVLAALFFRLNVGLVFLGTQVSIPPLIPLLIFSSIRIGSRMTGRDSNLRLDEVDMSSISEHFLNYGLGSIVLGVFLSTSISALVYGLALKLRQNKKRNWTGHHRGGHFGNWFLRSVAIHLGLRAVYFCLLFVIPYFYLFAPKSRKGINEYWKIIRPEMSFFYRQFQVMRHFYHFAQVLIDRMYQSHHEQPQFETHASGFSNIKDAIESKSGLVVIGGHIGAWDTALVFIKYSGVEGTFNSVQHRNQKLSFKNVKAKDDANTNEVIVNSEALSVLNVHFLLKEGQPIAFMADRPNLENCELVPMFGKLTPMDSSPFRLAALSGVPVVFSNGFREGYREYSFYSTEQMRFTFEDTKDRKISVYDWMLLYVRDLERVLETHPLAWFNFYPVWSSVPDLPLKYDEASKLPRNYLLEELCRNTSHQVEREFDSHPNASS